MDKILVTGGAGFIGSHLAERLLREGKRLAIVDNLDDYYDPDLKRANLNEVWASGRCEFFAVDIRDTAKLREVLASFQPEAVVHLAARPGVRPSFLQPDEYLSINVLGTARLLEISRQNGVRRFVFGSSSSVYGQSSPAPFREDASTTRPLSIYAATKMSGESLAYTYAQTYPLSVICLRLFTVFGPRQRPDLAIRKFAGLILRGAEVPLYGEGRLERDFTYVDDIVDGIVSALDAPGAFDIFNLGSSRPVRLNYMVETLAQALGKPVRRKFLPTPPGEMLLTHADLTKARQVLGYAPKISFEDGIRRFARWFQERVQV
jgi:UDP-glucuronate 4-epimerase